LSFEQVGLAPAGIRLSWRSVAGLTYVLQRNPDSADPTGWIDDATVGASGPVTSVTHALPAAAHHYRLRTP
jgi:hypothetical protein